MTSPLTLVYLQREGLVLRTWCAACGTGGADLDPEPLIAKFGAEMTIEAVTARLRCRRCGERAAEIRVAVRDLRMGLRGD